MPPLMLSLSLSIRSHWAAARCAVEPMQCRPLLFSISKVILVNLGAGGVTGLDRQRSGLALVRLYVRVHTHT